MAKKYNTARQFGGQFDSRANEPVIGKIWIKVIVRETSRLFGPQH